MKYLRRSLVGSTYIMEYILEISKAAVDARENTLTFPQIHNLIVRKAIKIQMMKTINKVVKPTLTVLEACHRLTLKEGQKENKKRRGKMKKEEKHCGKILL